MPRRLTDGLPAAVLVSTDAVGGVWRYSMELARGLAQRGCRITLAVLGPPPHPAQMREAAGLAGVALVATGLPLEWLAERPAELDRAAVALAGLAEGHDVVLLHSPALLGRVLWQVPVAVVAHSCLTTWFHAVRGGPVPPEYRWRAEAAAEGFRAADALAAPSLAFAAAVRTVHGTGPISVVHNGRDPIKLAPAWRDRAVLTVGRLWDDAKNATLLDRAAARLPFPVRAAGSVRGPQGDGVALRHMQLLGSLDTGALAEVLGAASVFASPAHYEPFGLSVLEAAQSGLALVLSDIPTFRELWDGAAVFVPPADEDAWVTALLHVAADPKPWADRARAHAARYTVAAMVAGTAELLDRAMARA